MTADQRPAWKPFGVLRRTDFKLPAVLNSEVRLPTVLTREVRVTLARPAPPRTDAPLIPPVVLLDLRDVPDPHACHAQVLELGDRVRSGIRLLVIDHVPRLADVHLHPGTLDLQVQYAGVLLPDPAWREMQLQALLLPGGMGLKLATLHGVHTLNEDNAAPVLQVSRQVLMPGVRCLDLPELEQALQRG